jgi:hypothetical protein
LRGGSVMFKKLGRAVCWIFEGCGALATAAGVVLIYVSSLAWLKFGTWPPNDVQVFWDNMHSQWPHVEWIINVQKILVLAPAIVLNLPLWMAFLIVGGSIYFIGFVGGRLLDDSVSTAA